MYWLQATQAPGAQDYGHTYLVLAWAQVGTRRYYFPLPSYVTAKSRRPQRKVSFPLGHSSRHPPSPWLSNMRMTCLDDIVNVTVAG